ncbi:MAG: cation-transporting P-type ATPase [Desulfuromonadaceae bacterium]|nr:cation-transporting P-type ATPase [Desulfuromonadaceae bacterium]
MAVDGGKELDKKPWHALDSEEILAQLGTSGEGLSFEQAQKRLREHGPNRLPPPHRRSSLVRFLLQFHNLLIYVLLVAAVIAALLGHWLDAAVIFGVVVINALIGFIQEGKAEKALESIRAMLSLHAYVRRGGRREEIAAEEVVPGDIVLLQAGDKVPADLRLLQVKELRIDEAILTGESEPVTKGASPVAEDAPVGDRLCLAFSGTVVTYGQGVGVVVETGKTTEIGRISEMLKEVESLTTPLLRAMDRLARFLTVGILFFAGITFLFGLLVRDYSATEMFLAAVSLIVAAIPEGLPAIVTITLAIGVQRMARRNAIIRRLPAVETLGSVTVICSDKTGTLTRNEMTVRSLITAADHFDVEGGGYDPHGSFLLDGRESSPEEHGALLDMGWVALLCNDSVLSHSGEQWLVVGDPTEGALLTVGRKMGLDPDRAAKEFPRIDSIPFESEHRFMATLHHDHEGHSFICLKGAPEVVLDKCSRQRGDGGDQVLDRQHWERRAEALAERGERLLAAAWKRVEGQKQQLSFEDVEAGLIFLGLFGITDPPREEAIEAVKACKSAGIEVKMITGDHAKTAQAIGLQMGIGANRRVVSGGDLENAGDDQLRQWVGDTDIFARASPEHKLRLVKALQELGGVAAMTGDGVNDAPALKRADIGVAMGVKGTEVAKEAAEMVLADDNFASIANAVEEGRTVYDNIKKAILFILPTNGGEALMILAAILLGRSLPITPVQILWINMITAVTLALSLAFEPPEADIMERPPRDSKEPILTPFLLWRIGYVSLILVAGTFGLFHWERAAGTGLEMARTVAVNTLVMFEVFYLLNARYIHRNVLSRKGLTGNPLVLMAIALVLVFQLLFTYAPPLQMLFQTEAMTVGAWLRVIGVGSTVFIFVELEKFLLKGRKWKY